MRASASDETRSSDRSPGGAERNPGLLQSIDAMQGISAQRSTAAADPGFRSAPPGLRICVLGRNGNRQMLDRPRARAPAPFDLGCVQSQCELRPAAKQGLQRTGGFDARELMAEAEVNSSAEG